uniref:Uncharacterized protein n=1 Tax=Parastrongyloides trichosuri TaxID=131310 RepID=A0A0N4ZRM1_PARTI
MNEKLIREFLEQVKKDKFNEKEDLKGSERVISEENNINDVYSISSDKPNKDDDFLEAFENFAKIICPKVISNELQCEHMKKSLKQKKVKLQNRPIYEDNGYMNYESEPELINKYTYTRITLAESLKTMRELRSKDEDLKKSKCLLGRSFK